MQKEIGVAGGMVPHVCTLFKSKYTLHWYTLHWLCACALTCRALQRAKWEEGLVLVLA